MPKFRKKPVVIEARKYVVDHEESISEWCKGQMDPRGCMIKTLEGVMLARYNDWIIKGVKGEFYPCDPDIFEATYEAV